MHGGRQRTDCANGSDVEDGSLLLAMHDSLVPQGRLGRPQELAEFAAFMVSERNSYMNGEVVIVDGGAVT